MALPFASPGKMLLPMVTMVAKTGSGSGCDNVYGHNEERCMIFSDGLDNFCSLTPFTNLLTLTLTLTLTRATCGVLYSNRSDE